MKQLLGVLLIMGLLVAYWPWVVGFVLIVFGVRMIVRAADSARVRADEKRAKDAAIVARADRQHQQVMAGNMAGVYGEYPPPREMMEI